MLFTAVLMVIVGYAVWEAQHWDAHTRTFPTIIGSALLVLLAGQFATSVRAARGGTERVAATEGGGREVDAAAKRRQRIFIVWLLGFGAVIWLFSFPIGGTLGTFAYLRAARERWTLTLAITAGTAAFFWTLTNMLNIFFPLAFLLQFLPL